MRERGRALSIRHQGQGTVIVVALFCEFSQVHLREPSDNGDMSSWSNRNTHSRLTRERREVIELHMSLVRKHCSRIIPWCSPTKSYEGLSRD